jgi:hypothetical protein
MTVDENGMLSVDDIKYAVFGYGEFINFGTTTPKHENCKEESSKKECSEGGWSGTDTWETAVKYAKHGWDAGIKNMQDYLQTDSTLINVEHSLVGHAVDVGRFLQGVPDTMVTFYDDSYRNKAPLTVYTKLTYLADVSGENAMEYTSKILETIAILNRTFNVKLVGVFDSINKHTTNMVLVNIKDTDERFVLNNLAFAYNPAFFRRFWFKWLETTSMWSQGYGSCPDGTFGKNKVGKALTKILPPQEQVIFMPDVYSRKDIDPVAIAKEAVAEQLQKQQR